MSINGVLTPFFWLHFWLHNGYTIFDCVTFFFLGNKKPFLSRVSTFLIWGTGGRASVARRREHRVAIDSLKIFRLLFISVQSVIADSVATCACFAEFFIYGSEWCLASLFDCVGRNKKARGD